MHTAFGFDRELANQVAVFRRFTRYYMHRLQPLRDAMRGPSMHAAYMRVLRALGEDEDGVTASWLAGNLRLDPGYVHRIIGWYRALGYVCETGDPADGRRKLIRLNRRGRDAYRRQEQRAVEVAEVMLWLVPRAERARMIEAMEEIERILARVRWDDIRTDLD